MSHIVSAIATSPGESAIGIIRLSGEGAIELVSSIFSTPSKRKLTYFNERTMAYGHIVKDEMILDEVMVAYFKGPRSYTKEDMVEIYTHGSYIALREVQNHLITVGASPAEPGEFTKRAFLNGRIDLSQAEAVMDLISSKTKKGFEVAIDQLEGNLSIVLNKKIEELTDLMAQIEVIIDYPDEDVEIISRENIFKSLGEMKKDINELATTYESGKVIKDGLNLVIIGRPNVGKSSLLNALLKESRAIVTHIAGTTRDVIEEVANIRGIPVRLVDTAGIRETDDMIEKMGVEKTKQFFNRSDMAILVLNASEELAIEDEQILEVVKDKKVIVLVNKIDLERKLDLEMVKSHLPGAKFVEASIMNDVGLNELEDAIESHIISGEVAMKSGRILTNARHYEAVVKAGNSIKAAMETMESGMPLDVIEVDLINAYNAIGEVVGKSVNEDVIARIFEKFCLGK
ncbi:MULTISPECIES: tRNA uridine-5-carboxymethylaminomethyl(34) synthesis GTPase MnmE [unclassified Fusibacter]|uniref:tRNA uridine-5-carboxymethylaminomethyl(34) synthesis GTPase MnmE n=1 Tax=unclassified Fusibacter TaxID=2624464 RepID=UPI001012A19D|nr:MULTISPECIES: tRNA uridine-5-carboxymethylaminomethyl(34) synthesis GTPase MnmE [unclassified Fusibacter]MCK8060853.1 tRNA uridine-5-carboxymethylaminomethyl(34) synthesis GTPase MnmE [Fusibacter sp. A2]NPE23149.1 tRNA uridine-5-carboxymethylaminomethyl(34) synthesis GTPase MnmE [Fusibacter sp. A1]RXV59507.1 tRNA uridine-5-carboxymethylaminomethyl(34) synthesis GTPase MnmE [Fusibacter sp. A1]